MIAIALQDFHRGGTERVAIELARLWVEMGRSVTIVCGSEAGGLRDTVDPRVRVESVGVRRGLLSRLWLGGALARRMSLLKPDIIFLPGNYHLMLAPALRGIAPVAAKISNPPLPGGIGAPVFRYFARAIDGFACMNGGLERDVARLVPGKSAATLYDPVEMPAATSAPHPDGVLKIVWIGRLEPQKDVNLALDTIAALKGRRDCYLTILGDGTQRSRVRKALGTLPVAQLGHVPDITPYLAAADVLLITSRYEGGPAVAIEALAMGVPVVSTDCSHLLQEVMTVPDAGRIVASRDPQALAGALADVASGVYPQRETLRALTARFEPRACARAYLDWFDTLAGHGV